MSAPLPALKDISANYLMAMKTDFSSYTIIQTQEANLRAAILARMTEICAALPQQLVDAAEANMANVDIVIDISSAHNGWCLDGHYRPLSSENFERYLVLDSFGHSIYEMLLGCVSNTLYITLQNPPVPVPETTFYRMFSISWPQAPPPS